MRALPRYASLDVAAIVVLVALALAGWWPTFAGAGWIVVGAIGLAVGIGWSLLLVSLRLGMDLVIESLPVAYVLTAGLVAFGSNGALVVVPNVSTLGRVLTGTFTGWRELVQTAPPVDSEGVVLLLPYALALTLGGIATAMAVRSRRPALPLLPLVLLLGVVLVLGRPDSFSLLGQGLAFAAVALGWVAHRGNRNEAIRTVEPDVAPDRVSPGRVLASGLVVLVAATCVVPLARAPQEQPRWLVREAVTPYDSEGVSTPLSTFRRFRPGPQDSIAEDLMFVVKGAPVGTPVRLAVLDDYDGKRWMAASERSSTDHDDRFLHISSRIDNPGDGRPTIATVRMRTTWDLDWLPMLGRLQALVFYQDASGDLRDAVRYNRSTGTALLPDGLRGNTAYELETLVAPDVLRPGMRPWPQRDQQLWEAAEFLDAPVQAWSVGAETPMEALFQVAGRLRKRGRYSDGGSGWESRFEAGQSVERLGTGFVEADMQVGNGEQYAATMALLANRMDIPARVVVGARPGRKGKVRGEDVNAWVEVRIANGSWRSLPPDRFMSLRHPRPGDPALPKIQMPDVPQAQPPQKPPDPKTEPEPEPEKPQEQEPISEPAPRAWWLLGLPILLVMVAPVAKAVRRSRRRSAVPASRSYAGAWDELLDRARDLGVRVRTGTRPRQAVGLAVPSGLAREADVAAFSEEAPSTEGATAYWSQLEEAWSDLADRSPRWRRLLAPLNPSSLLTRRGTRAAKGT